MVFLLYGKIGRYTVDIFKLSACTGKRRIRGVLSIEENSSIKKLSAAGAAISQERQESGPSRRS
jgi:predicted transcriptional regulator